MTVRLTRELASTGTDARALRLLQRAGSLARVRYGAYAEKIEAADRDAHLHAGARPALVAEIVGSASRRKGIRTARAALAFADARAESVGESISRVRMAEAGLPAPELQFTVVDRLGFMASRTREPDPVLPTPATPSGAATRPGVRPAAACSPVQPSSTTEAGDLSRSRR